MKILAMYLPQFHRVKENDEWWGEGFTEWTAVKKAKKLFPDHNQPREPFEKNYYDLLQKKTVIQQAKYMKKYGIDGMCFYHYYFKNGRKILEKPAENLLNWKEINMPFCFCWANESWVRTWSNINDGNPWMSIDEKHRVSDTDKGILLEQKYGEKDDWKKHFYYLLPFLKDKRYIKKDGHPVFVIYKTGRIYCLKEMLDYWNILAEKEGIPSFYIIGSNIQNGQEKYIDQVLIHEPQDTLHKYFIGHREKRGQVNQYSYDEVWKKILSKSIFIDNVCRGSFVDYDDTPRMGENGTAIIGATPQKFQNYFSELLIDAKERGCEYVFINAWNEWGEGMYLEPDNKNKFGYLEAFKQAKEILWQKNEIHVHYTQQQELKEEIIYLEETILRYRGYWKVLNSWMNLKESNKSIADFLKKRGLLQIAIYGLGMLGKHLVQELINTDIKILYGIDQNRQKNNYVFPIYTNEEEWEKVDVIIVTVGYAYEKIKIDLKQKLDCEIISLEEIIEEANQQ